jgi:hypothetical protein
MKSKIRFKNMISDNIVSFFSYLAKRSELNWQDIPSKGIANETEKLLRFSFTL